MDPLLIIGIMALITATAIPYMHVHAHPGVAGSALKLPRGEIGIVASGIGLILFGYYLDSPDTFLSFSHTLFGLKIMRYSPLFVAWLLLNANAAKHSALVGKIWRAVLRGFTLGIVFGFGTAMWSQHRSTDVTVEQAGVLAIQETRRTESLPRETVIILDTTWKPVANGYDECVSMGPVDRTLQVTYQQMMADSSIITYPAHGRPYKDVAKLIDKYGRAIDSSVADGNGDFHILGQARYARVLAAPPTPFRVRVDRSK